jgi:hypothetical protein
LWIAAADGAPLEDGDEIEKYADRAPLAGYYFRAMKRDESQNPPEPYSTDTGGKGGRGKVFNRSRFGFCAYPSQYGVTGRLTFIVNEGNSLWWADTGGQPALAWPSDADLKEHWARGD